MKIIGNWSQAGNSLINEATVYSLPDENQLLYLYLV